MDAKRRKEFSLASSDVRWRWSNGYLSITLLLIMVSGENLIERGRLEKKRKPKSEEGKPTEFWSPNFLGRLYQSTIANEAGNRSAPTQRLHWRCGSHQVPTTRTSKRVEKDHLGSKPYRQDAVKHGMKQSEPATLSFIEPMMALRVRELPVGNRL